MRRPKHLEDLKLLGDEPFVTGFPHIRDQLQRTRASRSQQVTFKSIATITILDKLKDNSNAVTAWLKLAFVPGEWDTKPTRLSAEDDKSILLFAEYYYNLFCARKQEAKQLLFEARKQGGFGGYVSRVSDGYDGCDEEEPDEKDDPPLSNQTEDVDIPEVHRDASVWQGTPGTPSRLTQARIPDTTNGAKKRKAEKEHPSSDSSSSVVKNISEREFAGFASSLSELTPSEEEPSPLSDLSDLDIPTANTPDQSVSAPPARTKPKKAKKPSRAPSRIVPSRDAANRPRLSAMMVEEARFYQTKGRDHKVSLKSATLSAPPNTPRVDSVQEPPAKTKQLRRSMIRKDGKRANKSLPSNPQANREPTIPSIDAEVAQPISITEKAARPTDKCATLPKTSKQPLLRGRKGKGGLKSKYLQSKDATDEPPPKKRRGHDGPIIAQETLPERTRATTRNQTVASKVALSVPTRRRQTNTQDFSPWASESISVPVPPKEKKTSKNPKKRSLTVMEASTSKEDKATSNTKQRAKALLPKRRGRKRAGSLPLPPAPTSIADADSVLRSAGAEGAAYLDASTNLGNTRTAEWEGVHTPAAQIPDDSSSEEDIPLRVIARSNTRSVNALTPIVAPTSATNNEHTHSNDTSTSSGDTAQAVDPEPPLQDIPINHDPVTLPEKPTQVPLLILPPIWAESRQEVCEGFDWFRSYQGGVYFIKDLARGYLLSAFSADRDVFGFNGKLIISHGGGKAESIHKSHGHSETHADSDQKADDKSVRALLTTYAMQRPLALVIDDKYAWFPYNLASKGCTYAVLGFYRIVCAWAEKQYSTSANEYVVRYKFAFQWCEEQGKPWWIQQPILSPTDPGPPLNANVTWECSACHRKSPQVYAEGWMCLQPSCHFFWKLSGREQPDALHYSNSFLQLHELQSQELPDLRPPPPTENVPDDGVTTTYHFTRGWHCRQCGRLSSRFKWEHWQCKSCGNIHDVRAGRYRTAQEFRHQLEAKQFSRHSISPQSGILKPFTRGYSYGTGHSHYVTFVLPKARGYIHLIFSAPAANRQADKILEAYQREAAEGNLKFRRWPMRAHKCRGTLLTNYFSQNTGEPYQYVGGSENTVSWDHAPTAVVGARELILERMKQSLGLNGAFNEVLSAAYMEKQRMAFHSDAEKGLGPTVASLSLGSSAYMHFRLHHQYASELADPSRRDVLSLFLRHGDVVIMQGADVQTYYEHTVVPLNFRIAATARFIDGANHH